MDKVGDGRYGGANRAFRSADGSQPYLVRFRPKLPYQARSTEEQRHLSHYSLLPTSSAPSRILTPPALTVYQTSTPPYTSTSTIKPETYLLNRRGDCTLQHYSVYTYLVQQLKLVFGRFYNWHITKVPRILSCCR